MNRPRILVNVAMTADGKIDSATRKGATISSPADKARVDRMRASVDAVLVGGRTLLNEDPKLTVKSAGLRAERVQKGWSENPAKVGVVSNLETVFEVTSKGHGRTQPLHDFLTSGPARRIIFTTKRTPSNVISRLDKAGAEIYVLGGKVVDLRRVMKSLYKQGIGSVLVEGGGTLIAELFRLNLVDELTIYIAPRIFGGTSAPTLVDGKGFLDDQAPRLKLDSVEKFNDENSILICYSVEHKE